MVETPEELMQRLVETPVHTYPTVVIAEMIVRHDEMVPQWLAAIEDAAANPEPYLGDGNQWYAVFFSLYLLAEHRVTAALDPILRLVALPGSQVGEMLGDLVSEGLCRIIASVAGGRLEGIHALIENPQADEFVRSAALRSLVTLVFEEELERTQLESYFAELFDSRLEKEPSAVWSNLCYYTGILKLKTLLPRVKQAYRQELTDSFFSRLKDIETDMHHEGHEPLLRERLTFIRSTYAETCDWPCFDLPISRKDWDKAADALIDTDSGVASVGGDSFEFHERGLNLPVKPPAGRNDPCPCGSGKKYKKCCGAVA